MLDQKRGPLVLLALVAVVALAALAAGCGGSAHGDLEPHRRQRAVVRVRVVVAPTSRS